MPSLTTKIGADSSEFRSDVGKLPGVVKQNFDKMKQASEGGISENVKGLKKSFGDLKDLLAGGGVVAAATRLFSSIIDHARNSKDATDENVAAVRRYGDTLKTLKDDALDFGVAVVGGLNRFGESVGTSLKGVWASITGTRAEFEATEAALDASEKSLREVERNLAEAKKHAAEFNALNAESKKLTTARAEAEMKALALTDQRALLQQKLLEAQRAEEQSGGNALARRTAQVEQLKIGNQLMEVSKAIDQESAKEREKIAKIRADERKQLIDSLTTEQQVAHYRREVLSLETLVAQATLSKEESDRAQVGLAEQKKELAAAENKLVDEHIALQDKLLKLRLDQLTPENALKQLRKEETEITASIAAAKAKGLDTTKYEIALLETRNAIEEKRKEEIDRHIAAADKLVQLRFDQLKPEQKIAALEKEYASIARSILIDKSKGKDTTEKEAALLDTNNKLFAEQSKLLGGIDAALADQYKKLLAMGLAQGDIIDRLKTTGATKGDIIKLDDAQNKLIEAQVEKLREQGMSREAIIENIRAAGFEESKVVEITDKATKAAYGLNKEWDNFFIKLSRTGREAEDQSTIALEGALRRAKSELERLGNDTSYQSVWAPNGKDPRYYTLQMEVQRMENELDARRRVNDYASRFGEDATRYRFGDTLTDKALRDIQSTGEKQQKDIERLTIAVTRSALFRKTAPGN